MKEAWWMHTVKQTMDRPTLIGFNDWLRDKADALERMKFASLKPTFEDSTNTMTTKTKTDSKVSASIASQREQNLRMTKSFVFHVSTPNTRSDSVLSPVNVQNRHVEVHTLHFCRMPSGFSKRILSVATKQNPNHLVTLAQGQTAKNQKKSQACLPSQMSKDFYK